MINNDVLRSIRYMLDLGDAQVLELAQLADRELALDPEAVHAYLKKEDAEGFVECPDRVLAHFLDGLVVHRRGRQEGAAPRPVEKRINNNLVLKKLRIAFELLVTRLPGLRLAPGADPTHRPTLMLRGYAELPLEFDRPSG